MFHNVVIKIRKFHSSLLFYPTIGTPSKPTRVNAEVNETATVITWSQPIELGGRNDTFYKWVHMIPLDFFM